MNQISVSRFLSFVLLLFEILTNLHVHASPDELNVPYVPYVVVDKNKDEFDYERLQDTIVKYLEKKTNRDPGSRLLAETSTTLYDFLKTSTSEPSQVADTRSINVHPSYYANIISSIQQNTRKPSTTKDNSFVTAILKVTTFQPHRQTTPPTSTRNYYQNSTAFGANYFKFVPVKEATFKPLIDSSFEESVAKKTSESPTVQFPFGSEMKCSLRSSRYVYDGECVSRKPVVETVCADRCIRYEYHKTKNPFFLAQSRNDGLLTPAETRKKVIALNCRDGDVKKQKVKLYCKDGTIINNIIRIVNSCICQEHSEKVHSTKRHQRQVLPKKNVHRIQQPRIQIKSRFLN